MKKIQMLTLNCTCVGPSIGAGPILMKKGLISTLVERWLPTFIVTCKLGLAVRLDQISRA